MENPYIYIKDEKGESKWEIFSVYVEEWNEEPYRKNFKTEKEWEEYIEGLREKSLYKSSGEIFGNIITLSTCSYEMEEGRLVIHGGKK